jgi:hypothetical protein
MVFRDTYHFLRHIASALARGTFVALILPLHDILVFRYPFMNERSPAIMMAGNVPGLVLSTPAGTGLQPLTFNEGVHP